MPKSPRHTETKVAGDRMAYRMVHRLVTATLPVHPDVLEDEPMVLLSGYLRSITATGGAGQCSS
ncbi:hypothetical protein [Nocardia harenae]|uniref:hypothetical protein n=1 Tax=Nocardia harenae TaxID=358707 RepID=UPI0012EE4392|nr:hypothetical protein [Nocardia harenae]